MTEWLRIELTGNEARLIFFSIKNKKGKQAESIRAKLIAASEERQTFLKAQKLAKEASYQKQRE